MWPRDEENTGKKGCDREVDDGMKEDDHQLRLEDYVEAKITAHQMDGKDKQMN